MPQIQRLNLPEALLRHLALRIHQREINEHALKALAAWLDKMPVVPAGSWYKRFQTMTVCGEGELIKTFLTPRQTPVGKEVE